MHLRDLEDLDDLARVIELERSIWGYTAGDDVTPLPLLAATVRRGAILVGAFDEDGEMAGFVYSFPAMHRGRMSQWSHMLGVTPLHRKGGLGRLLKLAQRDRALAMGVDLVEWTFDPLQAANAHFNFARLGAVADEYEENIYGASTSPLHGSLPTDRLIAQWWLRDPAVLARIEGRSTSALPSDAVTANELVETGEWPGCGASETVLDGPAVLVRVPAGFTRMLSDAPGLAAAWRAATREIFTTYFARGYRATDFVMERGARFGTYVLNHPDNSSV